MTRTPARCVSGPPVSGRVAPPIAPPRAAAFAIVLGAATLLGALAAVPVPARAQAAPEAIRDAVAELRAPALDLYRELLTYPNDAHEPAAMLRLVAWWEDALGRRGFRTERIETPGSPLLVAERRVPGADRTVLVYLQADGQPVDPSAWDQSSPYAPVLKERAPGGEWREIGWDRLAGVWDPDWRIFARSASDSKGPNAQFLAALDALERLGARPAVNLKVIVDTEEEIGSPHLPAAVERHRDRLAADALVIFDGPPHASGRPTLAFGARGIATATLTTYGARVPQHSGHYGNYVPNAAQRLADILASLEDDDGRVRVAGWYDGVSLGDSVRAILAAVPDDEPAIRRALGIAAAERVASTLQESLQYPSLNIRGMRAAWVGREARTIIPATALAELDIRLVPESDAARLHHLLRQHIEGLGYLVLDRDPTEEERLRYPRIARLDWQRAYAAFRTDFDSAPGRWLTRALTRLNGAPPIRIRTMGGSIPIAPFVDVLGLPAVIVPTVNPDNNQHSPNENLRLGDFVRGIETMAAVLAEPWEP